MEKVKKDLRVGNIIRGGTINEIRSEFVTVVNKSGDKTNIPYEAVRFVELNLHYIQDEFKFNRNETQHEWMCYERDGVQLDFKTIGGSNIYINHKRLPCRYVHNLQNIFYDFTTTELI